MKGMTYMKWLVRAFVIWLLIVIGTTIVWEMTRPRASISIDNGTYTVYYRNLSVEQANEFLKGDKQ